MINRIRTVLVLYVFLVLAGCASLDAKRLVYLEERKNLALQLEEQHRLADALVQWNALGQMFPNDTDIAENTARVEAEIESRRDRLLSQVSRLSGKNNRSKRSTLYLKILALEPGNQQAITALRESEIGLADTAASLKAQNIKRVYVAKKQKTEKARTKQRFQADAGELLAKENLTGLLQLTDLFLEKNPNNEQALKYRFMALSAMGDRELRQGQSEEAVEFYERALKVNGVDKKALLGKTAKIKQRLSEDYFAMGMKSFKSDIDKAIEYFQASVEYDPKNTRASRELQRATRIQKNLRLIQSRPGK